MSSKKLPERSRAGGQSRNESESGICRFTIGATSSPPEIVRTMRAARGLSQEELARAIRRSQSGVSLLERTLPGLSALAEVADALGFDLVVELRPLKGR